MSEPADQSQVAWYTVLRSCEGGAPGEIISAPPDEAIDLAPIHGSDGARSYQTPRQLCDCVPPVLLREPRRLVVITASPRSHDNLSWPQPGAVAFLPERAGGIPIPPDPAVEKRLADLEARLARLEKPRKAKAR